MNNANLHKARSVKDDEFYTLMPDIERELKHYKQHLNGAVVYCPCDHPDHSNFIKYFKTHFDELGLNSLMYSHGDFRGVEALELLRKSDVVITNPPFSLFREFLDLLMDEGKKFLFIGNFSALHYTNCWKYFKDGDIWLGASPRGMEFDTPDGLRPVNACWFTNMDHAMRRKRIRVSGMYMPGLFQEYDNLHAIEVKQVCHIPADYDGIMGVPITFLEKYNPDQFEIVGAARDAQRGLLPHVIKDGWKGTLSDPVLDGEQKYARILIRHKR